MGQTRQKYPNDDQNQTEGSNFEWSETLILAIKQLLKRI
jgi:hypothetical protein